MYLIPKSTDRRGDFILVKKNRAYEYECKRINQIGSIKNRLDYAVTQSDRIMLNVADKTNGRAVAIELNKLFEKYPQVKDVLIFKGKREIHITPKQTSHKDFVKNFMRSWAH